MILHRPQIQVSGSEIQIAARIEFLHPKWQGQHELWFRFPLAYADQISADLDPFAVALLLLAMQYRESLQIQGSISQELLKGLNAYQQIYHSWYPERFHLIQIEPESVRASEGVQVGGCGAAFSGGVDSFYALLELQPQITHTLFMAGFDMPINLKASIEALTDSYAQMMQELGIQFIHGSTNVRKFVNAVDWTNAHGQALAASALFFKKSWNTFLIPSSYLSKDHPRWGTHPDLDPLLSSDGFQFVHHGAHANRVQKLKRITQSSLSEKRLRVCWIQHLGLQNCGSCEKCIRTMTALQILGKLQHYTTFQDPSGRCLLYSSKIRGLAQRTHQSRIFSRELMFEAARRGQWGTVWDLGYSLLRREKRRLKGLGFFKTRTK